MATLMNLERVVRRQIENDYVYPEMWESEVRRQYQRMCRTLRVPMPGQDWCEARLWGNGPNEDFERYQYTLMCTFWGKNDYVRFDDAWPDAWSVEECVEAAEIGIRPSSLASLARLQARPEPEYEQLWEHFQAIRSDRSPGSPYAFTDLQMFELIVRDIGPKRALRLPRAKTWREASKLITIGLRPAHALALHSYVYPNEWISDLVGAFGLRPVLAALQSGVPCNRAALLVWLRSAGHVGQAEWFQSSLDFLSDAWDQIGSQSLQAIPADAYAHVADPYVRGELVRGAAPNQIVPELTRREGHAWLEAGCPPVQQWYAQSVLELDEIEYELVKGPYSHGRTYQMTGRLPVLRWYAAKRNSAGLSRPRAYTLPTGETIRITLRPFLDQIVEDDLPQGPRTSPDTAFQRLLVRLGVTGLHFRPQNDAEHQAAQRVFSAAQQREQERLLKLPFPVFPVRVPHPNVQQIPDRASLVQEGNDMGHCVGRYGAHCASGNTYMFSVRVGRHRSTVQITSEGRIVQHYGPHNQEPARACQQAFREFREQNNLA